METENQIKDIAKTLLEIKAMLAGPTASFADLTGWKTEVDHKVNDLHTSVDALHVKVDQITIRTQDLDPAYKVFDTEHIDLTKSSTAHLVQSPSGAASGHFGHGDEMNHRGFGCGVVTTVTLAPVTGAKFTSDPSSVPFYSTNFGSFNPMVASSPWGSGLPHIEFPQFDGHSQKMWKQKCESYFELYGVPPHMWIKLATMNFHGTAAFELQSVESSVKGFNWADFCSTVCGRFERDQQNQLIRQFFRIKQQSTVADYVEHFDDIVHQLRAHDPHFHPMLVTNRFIEGLRDDIKAVVIMHKPLDLDTASSLAMRQEELLGEMPRREFKRQDTFQPFRTVPKNSPIPGTNTKAAQFATPEEKQHVESLKVQKPEDVLDAIKAYRRAKGLCYKCGVKWNPGHRCAPTVALHVVEKI
jgi:hypothetical protein